MDKKNQNCVIVIPSRYASTRLPRKPLLKIAGKEMVKRVYENAMIVAKRLPDVFVTVATDDDGIESFCKKNDINVLLVKDPCRSGTERVANTVLKLNKDVQYVINLQGDNPTCPPWFVEQMILELRQNDDVEIVTPCVNLTWKGLDKLRESKKGNPFSGTTVVFNKDKKAIWFSKQIIPAIRKEEKLREQSSLSPIYRHIGLYGYRKETLLDKIGKLEETQYEKLEGLEQLAWVENNLYVKMIPVDYRGRSEMSGVDTEDDLKRAEKIISQEGDFPLDY